MAYSGNVGLTKFNALKVVEHAFRRCRLPAQSITAEMTAYAMESLYTTLSSLASIKTPSWCIEKVVLPMYENQPIVTLPLGTIDVLNLNYRLIQEVTGATATSSTEYSVNFSTTTTVDVVGIKWLSDAVPVEFKVSDDGITWTTVGTSSDTAGAGEITWTDISGAIAHQYFKVEAISGSLLYSWVTLGNLPQEVPLGQLNRDGYVNQSNKVFPGRPTSYYYQRNLPEPVVNVWPAPFNAAEKAQLVLWRHRQIMDTENLQQDVEIPARWLEAIIDALASKVAAETPSVDPGIMAVLLQKSALSLQQAWDGDGDGSPTQIQPNIGVYTK